jgi:hypothetical protein
MFKSIATGVLFVLSVLPLGQSPAAAELRLDPSHPSGNRVVLEGRIEAGDFERFKKIILDSGHVTEVYLASPGGDLAEAAKIGVLARVLKLSTVVPGKQLTHSDYGLALARHGLKDIKDYTCASACFFIFVAGIHRSADDHGPAILGVHSPTVLQNDLTKLSSDQLNALTDRTEKSIDGYLKIMDVPTKYIEEISSVPKNRIRWIRNDEFESDFAGFIPELRPLVKATCGTRLDEAAPSNDNHNDMFAAASLAILTS